MKESSKPILSYIPYFLNYCKEEGLSNTTQESYKRFLDKFVSWLKKTKRANLKPHELTIEDIRDYYLYLSQFQDKKGKSLKMVTQNYYLIALRALLNYFAAKDIVSLPANKITLPKAVSGEKTVKFLNLEQIERLLLSPNTKTIIGLRDRAILGMLISTGLKVNQLRNLNRDQAEGILSKEVSPWVKEYLKSRNDTERALFINYKGPRNSIGGRLTARSIERIVKRYGEIIGLPFSITPEILRWARALALSNKKIEIQKPQTHKTFIVKNYRHVMSDDRENTQHLSPTWDVVENILNKEVIWLKNSIPILPEGLKKNPSFLKCDNCILRKIAILITSGKAQAIEFRSEKDKDLWNDLTKKLNINEINRHGEEWHRKMMNVIYEYFRLKNYKVVLEPILNYGRADLGIYSNSYNPLYIEVDTVSLFKLWYNLSTMKNVTFLIVPSENKVVEFNTQLYEEYPTSIFR